MGAAYTLYKFKELFFLVVIIFIILGVKSQINPEIDKAERKVVEELDTTGMATTAMDVQDSILDPEGAIKQKSGNFFWRLLEENPEGFLILALIVTGLLFAGGVYLRDVRGFLRRL